MDEVGERDYVSDFGRATTSSLCSPRERYKEVSYSLLPWLCTIFGENSLLVEKLGHCHNGDYSRLLHLIIILIAQQVAEASDPPCHSKACAIQSGHQSLWSLLMLGTNRVLLRLPSEVQLQGRAMSERGFTWCQSCEVQHPH